MKIDSERTLLLCGPITEQLSGEINTILLGYASKDKQKPVYLFLDTPGGDVYAALSMYDMMMSLGLHIVVICTGKVMSAGHILLAAGKERYTLPRATFMVHNVMAEVGQFMTDPKKIRHSMDNTLEQNDEIIEMVAKISKLSFNQMKDLFTKETYFNAKEAIKWGLVKPLKGKINVVGNKEDNNGITYMYGDTTPIHQGAPVPSSGWNSNYSNKLRRLTLR